MQNAVLDLMKAARTTHDLVEMEERAHRLYLQAKESLPSADPAEMVIRRQVGRLRYSRRCPEASALAACRKAGIEPAPGMEIAYVVTDSRTWAVDLEWSAGSFDRAYYQKLLEKAWSEMRFAFTEAQDKKCRDHPEAADPQESKEISRPS